MTSFEVFGITATHNQTGRIEANKKELSEVINAMIRNRNIKKIVINKKWI